eukprot:gb/GECH01013176.1/.p1 GENE.gb/GECH01013176.1/~~gb/GECH01013176.1/.p1  ORF type:complete len:204 (+),score=44.37 gb/GECH01013176.1/:1-612(+)
MKRSGKKKDNKANSVEHLRLAVLGVGSVGKSALTMQFIQNLFVEDTDPTIAETYNKSVIVDKETSELEIIDTAGQEEYVGLRDQYMQPGDGFLVVFSVTDRQSFEQVQDFRKHITRVKESDFFPFCLIGNKIDLEDDRAVSYEEAKQVADEYSVPYLETSAKTGHNVELMFHELVRQVRRFRLANDMMKKQHGSSSDTSCVIL